MEQEVIQTQNDVNEPYREIIIPGYDQNNYCLANDWAYYSLPTVANGMNITQLFCSKINPSLCPVIDGYQLTNYKFKTPPGRGNTPIQDKATIVCSYIPREEQPNDDLFYFTIAAIALVFLMLIIFVFVFFRNKKRK